MMHMTFYWAKTVTLLFDSWRTTTWTAYLLTLLAVFLLSAFYQYLEDLRLRLKISSLYKAASTEEAPLLGVRRRRGVARCAVAALFGVNSALGYMLMLAVMSFNGGVFVAVVVGLTVGYLVFRSDGEEDVVAAENPCACS